MLPADDLDLDLVPGGEGDIEPAAAPAVVAVVVTYQPGDWLEGCLAALAAQDYPSLSVLVIDAASADDPTGRVAEVMPSAYVRRLDRNPGFGPAANEVLEVVEGAAFFLFCHDDVAPAPDAIRVLVEEAFRSNAGIVAPKLVRWDDPQRILQVGLAADKTGVPAALAEPGELDQEQHDAVRDVFVAPGGCTLVRADLFRALRGYDPGIDLLGEDLDLSWRAQVAGARIVVAPAAVVRHVEAFNTRHIDVEPRRLQARHRLRTMLTCYGPLHLARVLPQAFVLTVAEVVYSVLAGRRSHARDVAGAWKWNLAHRAEIRANRRHLNAIRQLPDSEVRRLQVRGSARFSSYLRGQIGGHADDRLKSMTNASIGFAGSFRRGPRRVELLAWIGIAIVLGLGTRSLFVGHLPAFADMPSFPKRPWTLFAEWVGGWRGSGLGSSSPAPTAFAVLGSIGMATVASMAAARRLLILVPLVVGALGAWKLLGDSGVRRARLVCTIAFLATPVPYNAIARGHGGGLLLWAASPWLLRFLGRLVGDEPFTRSGDSVRRTALRLGIPLALLAALVPFAPVATVVVALGLVLGGFVAGDGRGSSRVLGVALGAGVIAFVLNLPWALDLIGPGKEWSAIGGVRSLGVDLSMSDIVRSQSGPTGAGVLGFAFVVAGLLPLVIGRDWRFRWAVRAWIVALTCWGALWVGQQSWFHWGLGPPEAFLGPAAAAIAVAIALGLVAFEIDLPGYRFGWRQGASVAAAIALALGVLPVIGASFDGRWGMPQQGPESVLGFLHDEQAAGPFRVLWIGDPDVLPVGGWTLRDGVAYGTSTVGLPRVEDRFAGSAGDTTSLIADAIGIADRRQTARLGRLFAPMAIRYVVVAEAAAPFSSDQRPAPSDLRRTLDEQLDLQEVATDPLLKVYRNVAWAPQRTLLTGDAIGAAAESDYLTAAAKADLTGAPFVLPDGDDRTSARGPVTAGDTVYVAKAADAGWHLSVDGAGVDRSTAFGVANSFLVDRTGTATLSYRTPIGRYVLLLAQIALWVGAVVLVLRWRRERTTEVAA